MTDPSQTDRIRCFGTGDPLYEAYHDEEWGRPFEDTRDERGLYERLCLEAFQAGLSWITILRRREAFREAFHGFDPTRVAEFGPDDVERLMADASIIRNRAKINAAVTNARALLALHADGQRLHDLIAEYVPAPRTTQPTADEVPATTTGAKALSARLKKLGFTFVGPVTLYSTWQATGMVDDHVADCWLVTEGTPA